MIRKYKTVGIMIAILFMLSHKVSLANSVSVKEDSLIGEDRYKTAVEISKAGWNITNKALLVNENSLSDALCASPLADEYDAPILLTDKEDINEDTLEELIRLEVKEITIIGSEDIVSKSQEEQLIELGFKVERIGGVDIYDTSLQVGYRLKELYREKGNVGKKTVFLANGVKGLADATSVSSPAGIKDAVILYINGTNLNGVKSYIETSCDEVYLIGGANVISQGIENELKNTTNKSIKRLSGVDRKDTNTKVIREFFPNKEVNKIYVAKDGMGDSSQLVDGLTLGSLASKNNSPVVLASENLASSQKIMIHGKDIKEVVQVGGGKNSTPYAQTVGIVNKELKLDEEYNMKLPNVQFAKEGNMLMTGNGGYGNQLWNKIDGNLYVKWGNEKTRPHSYGSKNQEQYNFIVNYVKNNIKTINYRLKTDWVYLQYHLNNNGNIDDSFIDPVLKNNGITTTYNDWKLNNKYIIIGLEKGIVSRVDAEKLAMYNATVSHIKTGIAYTNSNDIYSAYDVLYNKKGSCNADAALGCLIGDLIGLSTAVGGSYSHQDIMIKCGNYWWNNGKVPTFNATDNLFQKLDIVLEAPTY